MKSRLHFDNQPTNTVEMQRRLNTSTLSTLNKPSDPEEVFKVGFVPHLANDSFVEAAKVLRSASSTGSSKATSELSSDGSEVLGDSTDGT